MDIVRIAIDKAVPNTWNPNHIKPKIYTKLKSQIKAGGNILPIVVRQHPSKRGCFEIIDGFHRWKISQELGYTEIDVIQVEADDNQAKLLTVNLNYMRGNPKPHEYAQLIHSLTEFYTVDDLALMLPEDKPLILDKLELLKLPSDLHDELESKADQESKDTLTTISFQVTEEEKATIDAALSKSDKKKKGTALAEIAKAALENNSSLTT